MTREEVLFKSNGAKLAGILELPEGTPAPCVIFLHGHTNDMEDCPLFQEMREALLVRGIGVFRFDQYGSGKSPGLFKEKLFSILAWNAKDAIDFVKADARISKIGLFGVSTGGTLITLVGSDPAVSARVLVSASFNLIREFRREAEQKGEFVPLGADPQTGKAFSGRIKGDGVIPRRFFEELMAMEEIAGRNVAKMGKVLVLHGSDDLLVNPKCAKEIFELTREPKEIHILHGAGHNCKKEKEKTVELSANWLQKWLTS